MGTVLLANKIFNLFIIRMLLYGKNIEVVGRDEDDDDENTRLDYLGTRQ